MEWNDPYFLGSFLKISRIEKIVSLCQTFCKKPLPNFCKNDFRAAREKTSLTPYNHITNLSSKCLFTLCQTPCLPIFVYLVCISNERGWECLSTPFILWCLGPELNRHGGEPPRDFKSLASTNSATQALFSR